MINWLKWKPMPSPHNCRQIEDPEGPGAYQLINRETGQFILFGESVNCRKRMKSFFPEPYGVGRRNNSSKREYVLSHWEKLDYRIVRTGTKEEAVAIDRIIKSQNNHLFNT